MSTISPLLLSPIILLIPFFNLQLVADALVRPSDIATDALAQVRGAAPVPPVGALLHADAAEILPAEVVPAVAVIPLVGVHLQVYY